MWPKASYQHVLFTQMLCHIRAFESVQTIEALSQAPGCFQIAAAAIAEIVAKGSSGIFLPKFITPHGSTEV